MRWLISTIYAVLAVAVVLNMVWAPTPPTVSLPAAGEYQCFVEHVSGDASARACWTLQLLCEHGRSLTSRACQASTSATEATHLLPASTCEGRDACDRVGRAIRTWRFGTWRFGRSAPRSVELITLQRKPVAWIVSSAARAPISEGAFPRGDWLVASPAPGSPTSTRLREGPCGSGRPNVCTCRSLLFARRSTQVVAAVICCGT